MKSRDAGVRQETKTARATRWGIKNARCKVGDAPDDLDGGLARDGAMASRLLWPDETSQFGLDVAHDRAS